MNALNDLADRVEAATADQQREMLEQAFVAIHGTKPPRVHGGSAELTAWLGLHNPFFRMLVAEAYESAALMLLPEADDSTAVFWRVGNDGEGADPALFKAQVLVVTVFTSKSYTAVSDDPALALTAAALRTRGEAA